jgi:cell division septum initiation protein DivIVA
MEEANSEAEHKGWCDTELATNQQTREIKTEHVDHLTSEVEKLTADIAKLGQEIGDLTDAIAEIDAELAKALEMRQAEKEKNAATIKDAKEGQEALTQGMAVLREFYAKAAEATSLAQQTPAEDAPETFDSPYQGQQDAAGGVMGLLEVILSDFARLEGDTEAAEAQAQDEYDTFVADSEQDKAVKQSEMEHKETKKKDAEQALISTKRSLEEVQGELDAALKYYEELKPSCDDAGVTWEERVAARKEEIQSLKEAYEILGGDQTESGPAAPTKGLYEMER